MKKLMLYIFVGIFFVPIVDGASAMTRDELITFPSKQAAVTTIKQTLEGAPNATEFVTLQKILNSKEEFSDDELKSISALYYKACVKYGEICGSNTDAMLDGLDESDFDDVDLDALEKEYLSEENEEPVGEEPSGETNTTGTNEGSGSLKDKLNADIGVGNNILGGASMAAMGIGAMQVAQGISEKKADKEAEADMRRYLSTFKCDYANGKKTVKYGLDDVTLDIGANLVKQVTEYKTIVARLKKTKKALNLSPGIEEETIIDPADTGLYTYEAVEKVDGHYTSLSKAILDEESEDAKEWEDQKSKSKKRVIGGAIAAGVGTAGSLVNSQIIDKGVIGNSRIKSLFDKAGGKEGVLELIKSKGDDKGEQLSALREKLGDKVSDSDLNAILEYANKKNNKDSTDTEDEDGEE